MPDAVVGGTAKVKGATIKCAPDERRKGMPLAHDQQLFECHIERVLGRGAFGTVYL